MKINMAVDLGNVLAFLGILITFIIAIYNIRLAIRNQRADQMKNFLFYFYDNEDLKDMFYRIDWNELKPLKSGKFRPDDEKRLDALIDFFDTVGYFQRKGVIRLDDLRQTLGYFMIRTAKNAEVQRYFKWLKKWVGSFKSVRVPGTELMDVVARLEG